MKLKLTLQRSTGPKTDIVVAADAVATVGDVATAIAARDPLASAPPVPHTLSILGPTTDQHRPLDPDTPLSDSKLASGSAVATVPVAAASVSRAQSPVVAILRIDAGPDKGREFSLRRGSTVVGRDETADIVITDPLVSKRHARIEVSDTIDIVDLNSANGVVIDGSIVSRARLESSGIALLGDTAIRVEVVQRLENDSGSSAEPISFNRSPRVEPRYPGSKFDAPDVPKEIDPIPFPWLAFAAPIVIVSIMFFVVEQKTFLIFFAMSPVIMAGTYFTQVAAQRAKLRRSIAKFERQLDSLRATLGREQTIEREVREAEAPDTAFLLADASQLGPALWYRRPEHRSFLNVRLGTGAALSRNSVATSNRANGLVEFRDRVQSMIEEFRLIPDVAIVENLGSAGCLGIAGDHTPVTTTANAIIAQLCSLYSPTEMSIGAIVSPSRIGDFAWMKWLPHTGSLNSPLAPVYLAGNAVSGAGVLTELEELIGARTSVEGPRSSKRFSLAQIDAEESIMGGAPNFGTDNPNEMAFDPPFTVVLISDDAPVDRSRINSIVERAVRAGILPIWIADAVQDLPAACRTFLDLGSGEAGTARAAYVRAGVDLSGVTVPGISTNEAEQFAKNLARVSDASAVLADESDIPRSISLLALLGTELAVSAEAIVDRWRQNGSVIDRTSGAHTAVARAGRLRALVGQGSVDALHLDLRSQGPHALVGGTTGSGKSEFLQAWALGMAAEYSPDRVTFLFVDYKGGSAFAECVELPHCVGLVTDLTPHLVSRALISLRAELRYRELLFNRKKAKDIIELEKRGDPDCPPALVLVIDEFAALVNDVPAFVDGIVDIAQRGRSLGIHLIMATQRPAGVIKDNLRANTNLRVALRVADAADSTDVVGSPIAADFDPGTPGRAVVKTGSAGLVGFQTGYAGGWTTEEPAVPDVDIVDLDFGVPRTWKDKQPVEDLSLGSQGANDTSRLVSTMIAGSRLAGIAAPRKPWQDELAAIYDSARLRQRTDAELVLGVVDDPANQSQYPVYFRPDLDGNLGVYGSSGSGKTVALRTVAVSAAITPQGGPVQIYAIDLASAGLRMIDSLPHVGAVVDGDDSERISRLLAMLATTIEVRAEKFAAVRAGSIAEYRSLANAPDEPRIIVLIDGAGAFRQQYEYFPGSIYTDFQQILGEGRSVGVHTVLSIDRAGAIPSAISSSVQRKLVLRLTDENDYSALDVRPDILSSTSEPGRGILDGREMQVGVFGGSRNVADQARTIDKLAVTLTARGLRRAPTVARLEDDIELETVPALAGDGIMVGVADDDLAPVAIEARGTFALIGPPSSGRSTALTTAVRSSAFTRRGARSFYFGSSRSALTGLSVWESMATSIEQAVELAARVRDLAEAPSSKDHSVMVVIEGLSDFLSTAADAALIDMIKAIKRGDHFVMAESETSTWSSSWPLLQEIKSGRRGFSLQPEQQEGDLLFRTSFPRAKRSEFPPGRGYLIQAGRVRRVQWARATEGVGSAPHGSARPDALKS